MSIPSHAELLAAIGQPFMFDVPGGDPVAAHLSAAPAGTPMDDAHDCYLALFELPPGIHLPQDVFHITAPNGKTWDLLATPVAPVRGRGALCVVIHSLRDENTATH